VSTHETACLNAGALYVQINKRGVAPLGGGEVVFSCPTRQKLRPVQFIEAGKVRRIRGVAYLFSVVVKCLKGNCTSFSFADKLN